jgi:hypothetical protein
MVDMNILGVPQRREVAKEEKKVKSNVKMGQNEVFVVIYTYRLLKNLKK